MIEEFSYQHQTLPVCSISTSNDGMSESIDILKCRVQQWSILQNKNSLFASKNRRSTFDTRRLSYFLVIPITWFSSVRIVSLKSLSMYRVRTFSIYVLGSIRMRNTIIVTNLLHKDYQVVDWQNYSYISTVNSIILPFLPNNDMHT